MNEFPPDLKMALTESAYGFANEHRHQDPYYRQQQDLNIELYRSIYKRLNKKYRKKMMRMEALQNELVSIDEEYVYLKGMADCAALLRTMGLV